MRYAGDTAAAKDISAALAIAAQQQQLSDCTGLYNLFGRDCDHFATWCRTMRCDARAAGSLPPMCVRSRPKFNLSA